jgi:hypothetical protein
VRDRIERSGRLAAFICRRNEDVAMTVGLNERGQETRGRQAERDFHSCRRAVNGSTRDARHAGKYAASWAVIVSATIAAATATGSIGVTPNSIVSTPRGRPCRRQSNRDSDDDEPGRALEYEHDDRKALGTQGHADPNFLGPSRIDPWRAATVSVLLITVVLTAAWMPARRAGRIEPTLALRLSDQQLAGQRPSVAGMRAAAG